jgi:hypothetical protein
MKRRSLLRLALAAILPLPSCLTRDGVEPYLVAKGAGSGPCYDPINYRGEWRWINIKNTTTLP